MNFRTEVALTKMANPIRLEDKLLLIGSCFVENIGKKFQEAGFQSTVNPFGTLYNPMSIYHGIRRLMDPQPFAAEQLFLHQGLWHSFSHHSCFSRVSKAETLQAINDELDKGAERFNRAQWIIVTFGTTAAYLDKRSGEVVANCHKMPDTHFVKHQLTQSEIVASFEALISDLHQQNPTMNWIFTVSPIRHWKDGAHQNQLSKATLLLAIDQLQQAFPFVHYFPAYELMMDELRDYRFYGDDMLHPSQAAIEFIWEKVLHVAIDERAKPILKEILSIRKALAHRSFQPSSEIDVQFRQKTLERMRQLQANYPFVHFEDEP
ncbi:MAG: GSCFA domain-containing protein [Microbacter sp.]